MCLLCTVHLRVIFSGKIWGIIFFQHHGRIATLKLVKTILPPYLMLAMARSSNCWPRTPDSAPAAHSRRVPAFVCSSRVSDPCWPPTRADVRGLLAALINVLETCQALESFQLAEYYSLTYFAENLDIPSGGEYSLRKTFK